MSFLRSVFLTSRFAPGTNPSETAPFIRTKNRPECSLFLGKRASARTHLLSIAPHYACSPSSTGCLSVVCAAAHLRGARATHEKMSGDEVIDLLVLARSKLLDRAGADAAELQTAIHHIEESIAAVSGSSSSSNSSSSVNGSIQEKTQTSSQETQTGCSSSSRATQANPAVATASTATGAQQAALGARNGGLQENRSV